MPSLITIFRDMADPRSGNAQRHDLPDAPTIALVASVCAAESRVDFAEFAEDWEALLGEFPSLENGLPGHDTLSRVFRLLDPVAFGRAFEGLLGDLGADGTGVLAIDGKTLRRALDRAAGARHCMSSPPSGRMRGSPSTDARWRRDEITAARSKARWSPATRSMRRPRACNWSWSAVATICSPCAGWTIVRPAPTSVPGAGERLDV